MGLVSAKLIKQLSDMTGAGLLDCKRALLENNLEVEAAKRSLLQAQKGARKGTGLTDKKIGRETKEGAIAVASTPDNKILAFVEFHTETDFLARSEGFQVFAKMAAQASIGCNSVTELLATRPAGADRISDTLAEAIAAGGENIRIHRVCSLRAQEDEVIGYYVHNTIGDSIGGIAAAVKLRCAARHDSLSTLARQLSVHVAAANPSYIDPGSIPSCLLEGRLEEIKADLTFSSKPEHVLKKIIENKLEQFKQEVCLLAQPYVLEESATVVDILRGAAKSVGSEVSVVDFVRLAVKG